MSRPVVYDLTYVAARLHAPTPTGIERVDAAFARHFIGRTDADGSTGAVAVHYGLARPHPLLPRSARTLVDQAGQAWQPAGGWRADPLHAALMQWLAGPPGPFRPPLAAPQASWRGRLAAGLDRMRWRIASDAGTAVPARAIYLNVAQYAFEYPLLLRWLDRRPDVLPVFFIHDLLPLDHPEFFRPRYDALFERRVRTMARFARAAIVSSDGVAARVAEEMRRRGRAGLPLLSAPLPPPAEAPDDEAPAVGPATPYFLMVGTIEPRKNHLMVLHVWRSLVARGGDVPRLILVGPRGWENEQVVDLLDRSPLLRPYIAEVAGIGTSVLHRLMAGARAVLMPSFAEGYGLPVAEALAAGTPVIAADIPVFREVSQGHAIFLDPIDGAGWRQAITDLAARPADRFAAAQVAARRYRAPTWPAYFARVDAFLAEL